MPTNACLSPSPWRPPLVDLMRSSPIPLVVAAAFFLSPAWSQPGPADAPPAARAASAAPALTLEQALAELKEANTELKKDLEKKEQIDAMRKEFLSNVSHELKTPIALIQGYAEGLMDNINDDEESKEFYCEVIVDEARKMNQMVKKIMDLNQLEFGYNTLTMEHFDIIAMIRAVIAKSDILLKQKEINLAFDEDAPIYVWSDAYMSEEVFTNYLTNAINHADGEKRIDIQLEKKEKTVKITVHNTGEQIPEEDLSKLWDKFYKVDKPPPYRQGRHRL